MNITVKPDILLLYHYFTISVHCSTVEVQSVFLLISSSFLVYFTDCNCSMTGANETSCHPETGQCSCRENVIGQHCEQCEINHYNFNSGAGCSSCDCNPTYSTSLQCDGNTGVCSCKPGINGAKCTGCADQFYNLTDQGNVYNTYRWWFLYSFPLSFKWGTEYWKVKLLSISKQLYMRQYYQ